MTGPWLASYLVLGVLVLVFCFLVIGALVQIGPLRLQRAGRAAAPETAVPVGADDGPPLGSRLPELVAGTMNGFGSVTLAEPNDERSTLVVFLSPLCESCQHVVAALNALVEDGAHQVRVVAIMRADEQACRAFLRIFPLQLPLVGDGERTITMGFGVHGSPYGLLYDAAGVLVRKGIVTDHEELLALVGGAPTAVTASGQVAPTVESSSVLE
jgi:hypothetical protein